MGYYIGQFYFDKRDIFLVAAGVLLGLAVYFNYPIPYFNAQYLFFLVILLFIAKGIVLPVYDSAVFVVFLLTAGLTLFVPFFHSLVFMALSFLFLRILKAI